ncbi:hypothetical protein [Microbacterium murale]|uniref:DUF2188 domain-containing protein n=1 Tax=Microbacterium murale TaxID=1081040 RepID=A0ABQ1RIP6_9MICO|nr:hypothetical protein [Microbacterium murale]GGD69078.1 hypothetical protein GCM10007269_10250 [Microbacterium murale]
MAAGDIETFRRDGLWFNRIEGESRTLGPGFEKEKEAIVAGREAAVARQVDHNLKFSEGPTDDIAAYGTNPRDVTPNGIG